MNNICLIPARGGSKRIPRKNIKDFHGKPIIAWSIIAAKSSELFDEVYVSTDDDEIAEISRLYGANIPFMRPNYISDDYAIDKDVIEHFIKWLNSNKIKADNLCYLYATAPFISKETLIGCKDLLVNSGASSSITVTNYDYPVLRSLKKSKNGFLSFAWEEYANYRSQDLPDLIHDAAQCYFYDLKKYGKESSMVGYHIPRLYCPDIDTIEDFEIAYKSHTIDYQRL